jgi:hypothetical protein
VALIRLGSFALAALLLDVAAASQYPEPFHRIASEARNRVVALLASGVERAFCREWLLAYATLRLAHLETDTVASEVGLVESRLGRDPETEVMRGAAIEVVAAPPALPPDIPLAGKRSGSSRSAFGPSWTGSAPKPGDPGAALDFFDALTGGTGGAVYEAEASSIGSTFTKVLAEFRSRYLLTYMPQGVRRDDGWHRVQVKLKNRTGRVKARTEYFARPASTNRSPAPSASR